MDTSATAPAAPTPITTSAASAEVRCAPPLTGFAAEVAAIQKRYAPASPALTPEEQAAATLLMEVGRHSQADAERIARLLAPVFLPF